MMGKQPFNCHHVAELLPGYAVGALSDDECADVALHLQFGCQQCQQELSTLMEAASALVEGRVPIAPRPAVKQGLLQRVASESQADVDGDGDGSNWGTEAASAFAGAANPLAVAPNTLAVAPNTLAVAPNTLAVAPNTLAVAPNILAVVNGPLAVAPDPSAVEASGTAVAPVFSAAAPSFSAAAPSFSAAAAGTFAVAPNSAAVAAGYFGKPGAARPHRRVFWPWLAASLGAMAAGSLMANFAKVLPQYFPAWVAPPSQVITPQWQVSLAAAEKAFGPPRAQLTKFGGDVAEQGFQAAIFYDGLANQSHIFVFDTSPPAENQQLWLWFLDYQGHILSGGPLDYLGQHRAAGVLDNTDLSQQLMEAVITSEPLGEHAVPSSPPVGRAQFRSSS